MSQLWFSIVHPLMLFSKKVKNAVRLKGCQGKRTVQMDAVFTSCSMSWFEFHHCLVEPVNLKQSESNNRYQVKVFIMLKDTELTMELEKDEELILHEFLVKRNANRILKKTVHEKRRNTDNLLIFHSNHPKTSQKRSHASSCHLPEPKYIAKRLD